MRTCNLISREDAVREALRLYRDVRETVRKCREAEDDFGTLAFGGQKEAFRWMVMVLMALPAADTDVGGRDNNVPTKEQNETPPCYQPDGDGCAYQCYDGDDEPIDKCKECPLCYSDKQRHHSPPNEPLTLETVAEILAEQFGDECACNVNGNDEWLPMMCHYGDACSDPPEHLGCWMELLRNKYCRPPERQEGET